MLLEKIKSLNWSQEKIIYKNDKTFFLRSTPPTKEFWELWKIHKDKIKELGFSISKYNGTWKVNWWEEKQNSNTEKTEEKINIQLSKQTSKLLFPYQIPHTQKLIYAIQKHNACLDASDTGTGKSYCALALAKELKLFPIIITPKSVISIWTKIAKTFNIDCYANNYEQYRIGKTPYLSIDIQKKEKGKNPFLWDVPKNSILIFDEAQKTKNKDTQNALMLRKAKTQNFKILCLSATIADNPLQMFSLGYVLNLFSQRNEFWGWAKARGVYKGYWGMCFDNTPKNLQKIHNDIFSDNKGSRISIKELGDVFPDNQIINECYDMNSQAIKIQNVYEEMYEELNSLNKKEKEDKENPLTIILRARQQIEILKVPTLVELTNNLIESKNSVVIFVNFSETIKSLSKKLKTKCIIDGSMSGEEREKNISDFQKDKEKIIICNIKAGGVGVSLHDLNGNYSRISLISPTYSAQDLLQSFGRIHRAGAKTKAIQKIIFCANTIEEEICAKVQEKINNIHLINDCDLQ